MKKYALCLAILSLLTVYAPSRAMQGGLTKARYAAAAVKRAFSTQTVQQPPVPFFSLAEGKKSRAAYHKTLRALPWGKLADQHIKKFEKEENELQEQFLNRVGCTPDQYDAMIKRS